MLLGHLLHTIDKWDLELRCPWMELHGEALRQVDDAETRLGVACARLKARKRLALSLVVQHAFQTASAPMRRGEWTH